MKIRRRLFVLAAAGAFSASLSFLFCLSSWTGIVLGPPFAFALAFHFTMIEKRNFSRFMGLLFSFILSWLLAFVCLQFPPPMFLSGASGAVAVLVFLISFFDFRFRSEAWYIIPLVCGCSALMPAVFDRNSFISFRLLATIFFWQFLILVLIELLKKNPPSVNEEGSTKDA